MLVFPSLDRCNEGKYKKYFLYMYLHIEISVRYIYRCIYTSIYLLIYSFTLTFLTFTTTYKTFVDIHNWQTGSLGYITYLDNECGFVEYTQLSFVYILVNLSTWFLLHKFASVWLYNRTVQTMRQTLKFW